MNARLFSFWMFTLLGFALIGGGILVYKGELMLGLVLAAGNLVYDVPLIRSVRYVEKD